MNDKKNNDVLGVAESETYFGAFFRNGPAGVIFDNAGRRFENFILWNEARGERAATITTRYDGKLSPECGERQGES